MTTSWLRRVGIAAVVLIPLAFAGLFVGAVGQGKVASYIPELANVAPDQFGMAVVDVAGNVYAVGDAGKRFSIQSISKLFALTLAFQREGDSLGSFKIRPLPACLVSADRRVVAKSENPSKLVLGQPFLDSEISQPYVCGCFVHMG